MNRREVLASADSLFDLIQRWLFLGRGFWIPMVVVGIAMCYAFD